MAVLQSESGGGRGEGWGFLSLFFTRGWGWWLAGWGLEPVVGAAERGRRRKDGRQSTQQSTQMTVVAAVVVLFALGEKDVCVVFGGVRE